MSNSKNLTKKEEIDDINEDIESDDIEKQE